MQLTQVYLHQEMQKGALPHGANSSSLQEHGRGDAGKGAQRGAGEGA